MILLLGIYPNKTNLKIHKHPFVYSSTIHHSQDTRQPKRPLIEGMDREDMGHMHKGILLSHNNNEIMPFAATSMDLETIILSEVRKR